MRATQRFATVGALLVAVGAMLLGAGSLATGANGVAAQAGCKPVDQQYGQCGGAPPKDVVIKTSLRVSHDCEVTVTGSWRNLPAEVENTGVAVLNVLQVDGITTNSAQEYQADLDGSSQWVHQLTPTTDEHTLTAYTDVFGSVVWETPTPWPTKQAFCAALP